MSKPKVARRSPVPTGKTKNPRTGWFIGLTAAVLLLIVAAVLLWWNSPSTPSLDFQTVKGPWIRPDGGYVLEFLEIEADGTIEARYLNPQPINVAVARVSDEGGRLNVFVELRDRNYPGSTYTLAYDREKDLLAGTYYQAALGQRFPVVFIRRD